MNTMQLKSLKNNLNKYCLELGADDIKLKNAVSTILLELEKPKKSVVKNNNEILDIIDLIEKKEIYNLNKKYPKINYCDIKEKIELNTISEDLENYTILQLKVIYYTYTRDKDNNAIKTKNKKIVLNAVNEVLLEIQRSNALKTLQMGR